MSYKYIDAAALKGQTIKEIKQTKDDIRFETKDGKKYIMYHAQDCCESVIIHDIQGEIQSLVGKKLIKAKQEISKEWPEDVEPVEYTDSYTWTTYTLAVRGAKVIIRWLGESNGYYSEDVNLEEIE